MPLDPSCYSSDEVCCPNLYDIAYHILDAVYVDLLACFQPGFCDGFGLGAYVTMGQGDDAVFDALSVSLDSIRPSDGTTAQNRTAPIGSSRAVFIVRLLESGWPMAQELDGVIYPPDPVVQNRVARHSFAHGERMYRKLWNMASTRDLAPHNVGCTNGVLGPLLPVRPLGGITGWTATVTLSLAWS